ncbi:hypothetical protein EDB83DRAFT_2233517 [Lactarius deliciosus]|nr:hypothetical protein EDB83DRAFT_2233517 [Lactarius deliciosus]
MYKQKCEQASILVNHHAIPPKLTKAQVKEKIDKTEVKKQMTLDDKFARVSHTEAFTREAALQAVAQFVACDDQAFAVANNKLFQDCLVSMRPKTKASDLPSSHDVGVYVHNECLKWLKQLWKEITVSTQAWHITK